MSFPKQSILFVSGLEKTVNENQLYQLFNDYPISYIKIAKEHPSRESFGYAFVGFKSQQKAEEALNALNYKKLNKKTLRISWYNRDQNNYRDHPEFNVFVKKIQKSVTSQEFHEFFSKFGNVVSARLVEDEEGENVGFGFVLYDNKLSADLAIREANNQKLKGKELFVGAFIKNRPRKVPAFNNIYVKNIPIDFSEADIINYFKVYGEIGSYIIRNPDPNVLRNIPEEKKQFILNHKYAFICYKKFDSASIVVNQVSYLKITNKEYNSELLSIVKLLKGYCDTSMIKQNLIKEENLYRCACYIIENYQNYQTLVNDPSNLQELIQNFETYMEKNDNTYVVKDKTDRMECCQALKKAERTKRLNKIREKIKKQMKEKFRFCNLYVKNLPDNFTDEMLYELFEKYGRIHSAKTIRKELIQSYMGISRCVKVSAFVCFKDEKSAKDAKVDLNLQDKFPNQARLYVDYHQSKLDRAEFLKLKQIHYMNNGQVKGYGQSNMKNNGQVNSNGTWPKKQEIMKDRNQNMLIQQMQMSGIQPQFGNVFGPNILRKFPSQTSYNDPVSRGYDRYQGYQGSQGSQMNQGNNFNNGKNTNQVNDGNNSNKVNNSSQGNRRSQVVQHQQNSNQNMITGYQNNNNQTNMNKNQMQGTVMLIPPQHVDLSKMDPNVKREYLGEILFGKISSDPNFANSTELHSKIIGIFLDINDDRVKLRMVNDDEYFANQQLKELQQSK